jgi:translation elongation factor EF-1beta
VPVIENYGIYPLQINILIDDKVVELDLYVNAFSKIFKGY